jgi:hypothetical protein
LCRYTQAADLAVADLKLLGAESIRGMGLQSPTSQLNLTRFRN